MRLYELNNKLIVSFNEINYLEKYTHNPENYIKTVYFAFNMNPLYSRKYYSISDPELLFIENENLNLIVENSNKANKPIPEWLINKIKSREVMAVNTAYPNWEKTLDFKLPNKWRINILALGDVGGTLLTGLRLLGGNYIKSIGIYDRSKDKQKRWEYEINQIYSSFNNRSFPKVSIVDYEDLFDTDMFVFCASKRVPPVGKENGDVRMIQYKANAEIISTYAKMARNNSYNGIFAVVSDPVDLLSKTVFIESNKDEDGKFDFKGISPEQIRGYGLGVMNARAYYYADKDDTMKHYISEGRAYGPHGEGLIIADSIENYNNEISLYLTEKAKKTNLEIRKTGFKPYIAPALSSGALSIIDTIAGNYHYSSTFMGGVFMGAKNRLTNSGTELERLKLNDTLYRRLLNTYKKLEELL